MVISKNRICKKNKVKSSIIYDLHLRSICEFTNIMLNFVHSLGDFLYVHTSFLLYQLYYHSLLYLLHAAASLNWNLISLADLLAFLFIQYNATKIGKLLTVFVR